jgi:SAM-dependent methyltransferase
VPSRPYDAVPYPTYPRIETHPDRLATVATLAGMRPAAVTRCRVLEIGCGDGGNLAPMAYFLPHSEFLGVDLAGGAIARGRELVRALKLRNIELRERDLCDLGPGDGAFDFILAQGLYSWVPPAVRDRLLAVCAELLAPEGVAYVSYNVWPGRHERHILREILLYHLRDVSAPRRRLREALRLLDAIATPAARALRDAPDDLLFHDDLAPVNDPVWFRDFAAHAEAHGLQYLGDAGPGPRQAPDRSAEQYSDFLRMRGFRQSLLCRAGVALRTPSAALMPQLLFSIASPDAARDGVTAALRDAYPLPLPFAELEPYGGASLADDLFALYGAGIVDAHVFDFPCEEAPGPRPRATRLARTQAKRSRFVTGARHHLVELSEADRALLLKLDGRRRCEPERAAWFARMGLLEA